MHRQKPTDVLNALTAVPAPAVLDGIVAQEHLGFAVHVQASPKQRVCK